MPGWDAERRFELGCEPDAAFFHLCGLSRDEAACVMSTFPIGSKHRNPLNTSGKSCSR